MEGFTQILMLSEILSGKDKGTETQTMISKSVKAKLLLIKS